MLTMLFFKSLSIIGESFAYIFSIPILLWKKFHSKYTVGSRNEKLYLEE